MGLPEYLRTGRMHGREFTRDQLDQRLVIAGDLDIAESIASTIGGMAEPFDHITISFAETNISPELLEAYTKDFQDFMLSAFGPGELYFYAEAHIPKIQTYRDKEGNEVFRYPHIHIAVPKVNLLTGGRESAFEMLNVAYGSKMTTWELIKAKQEQLNAKYGVKSPDDSRRLNGKGLAEIIAGRENKIDDPIYSGITNRDRLLAIQDRMIAERVESREAFLEMLGKIGKVKHSTEKAEQPFVSVRFPGDKKFTRLYPHKHYQFTDEFICQPTAVKVALIQQALDRQEATKRTESGIGRPTPEQYTELLAGAEQRMKEIRFLHMGTRLYKEVYSQATPAEKLAILADLEAAHFAELKAAFGYNRQTGQIAIGNPLDHALKAAAQGVSLKTLNAEDGITKKTTRSKTNAKGIADPTKFDRFGPHPEATGRQPRLRQLRSLDVDADQHRIEMLLQGDARSDLGWDQADAADFGMRHGADGRGTAGLNAEEAARLNAYQDALADTRTGHRLRSIYGRSIDELRDASIRGQRIIEDAGTFLDNLTFNESVFTAGKLELELAKHTADEQQYNQALLAVLSHPHLVIRTGPNGKPHYTTSKIVEIEAELVRRAEAMASAQGAALKSETVAAFAAKTMNAGQASSYRLLCSARQLVSISGAAGTGKSFILKTMREAYEREGFQVHGAILMGKTAQDLELGSGIKSQTMHSFLSQAESGKLALDSKSVIVVDEAGMIGSSQMNRVLALAEKTGARVRLVGDAAQLAAVEYGNAFAEVSKRCKDAGSLGSLTEIMRQKEMGKWACAASEAFSRLDIAAGLSAYAERGFVSRSATNAEAEAKVIREWAAERAINPGKSMIVMVATNAARQRMNRQMREVLKDQGQLADGVIVETATGFREFATSDRIMFTKNDRELGTKNGTFGTISKIDGPLFYVTTDDGAAVVVDTRKKADLDHCYAITVHKSQGMTVDKAWALVSENMAAQNLYVACTRHKNELRVEYSAQDFPVEIGATTGNKGQSTARLLEHGKAPYDLDPENSMSYYMSVEVDGMEQTVWGKGLEMALAEADAKAGDFIKFGITDSTDVVLTDEDGEEIEAKRNAWQVEIIDPEEAKAEAERAGLAALIRRVGQASKKEFSHQEHLPEWSAVRESDSVVAQLMADLEGEKLIERTAQKANFREVRDNLDAGQLLDYLAAVKGVVSERYAITKDDQGRDRIECGKKHYNVSDFLAKELKYDFKTQALPLLKTVYQAQQRAAFIELSGAAKEQTGQRTAHRAALADGHKRFVVARTALSNAGLLQLKTERGAALAEHKAATNAGEDKLARQFAGKSRQELRAALKTFKAEQAAIKKAINSEFAAKRAALLATKARPSSEVYKDYLELEARSGTPGALEELYRIAAEKDLIKLEALARELKAAEPPTVEQSQETTAQDVAMQEAATEERQHRETAGIEKGGIEEPNQIEQEDKNEREMQQNKQADIEQVKSRKTGGIDLAD